LHGEMLSTIVSPLAKRSKPDYGEFLNRLKVAVSADKRCAERDGGCGDPKVILVERETTALLRNLRAGVPVASGCRNRLTRQYGEDPLSLALEFGSAPPRSERFNSEQNFASGDSTHDHPIIGSNR
jgi:hypothetical protein